MEFLLNPLDEPFRSAFAPLYHLEGDSVHAWCAAVGLYALPRATHRLVMENPPVQIVEAGLRLCFRLSCQSLRHQREVGVLREVALRAYLPNLPLRQVPFTQSLRAASLRDALRAEPLCSTVVTRFPATTDSSDSCRRFPVGRSPKFLC